MWKGNLQISQSQWVYLICILIGKIGKRKKKNWKYSNSAWIFANIKELVFMVFRFNNGIEVRLKVFLFLVINTEIFRDKMISF